MTAVMMPSVPMLAGSIWMLTLTVISLSIAAGIILAQKIARLQPHHRRLALGVAAALIMVCLMGVQQVYAQVMWDPVNCCPQYAIYFLCLPIGIFC